MYNDDINGEQQYLPNQEALQQCKSNISFKAHPVNTTNGRQHPVWNHLLDFYNISEHSHKCQQQNKSHILKDGLNLKTGNHFKLSG